MDPRQCLGILPKALQFALFLITDGLRGTKKRDSNGLKLFGRVAIVSYNLARLSREQSRSWITSVPIEEEATEQFKERQSGENGYRKCTARAGARCPRVPEDDVPGEYLDKE